MAGFEPPGDNYYYCIDLNLTPRQTELDSARLSELSDAVIEHSSHELLSSVHASFALHDYEQALKTRHESGGQHSSLAGRDSFQVP